MHLCGPSHHAKGTRPNALLFSSRSRLDCPRLSASRALPATVYSPPWFGWADHVNGCGSRNLEPRSASIERQKYVRFPDLHALSIADVHCAQTAGQIRYVGRVALALLLLLLLAPPSRDKWPISVSRTHDSSWSAHLGISAFFALHSVAEAPSYVPRDI